jgi:hypothetical protein
VKYYVKDSPDGQIEGPYSPDQIRKLTATGALSLGGFATSDIGESFSRVLKTPDRDWLPINVVCGLDSSEDTGCEQCERIPAPKPPAPEPSFCSTEVSAYRVFILLAFILIAMALIVAYLFARALSGMAYLH